MVPNRKIFGEFYFPLFDLLGCKEDCCSGGNTIHSFQPYISEGGEGGGVKNREKPFFSPYKMKNFAEKWKILAEGGGGGGGGSKFGPRR